MNSNYKQLYKEKGLTLVELMVAMVIGLVLVGGVIQIFVSNKQAYRVQEAMSRVQENGRFAIEIFSRNTRMAGFTGCGSLDVVEPNVIANNPPAGGFSASNAVFGYEYDGSAWTPAFAAPPANVVANTDVITINRGDDCGAYLLGNMTADNANIQLNPGNSCGFTAGDIIIISDCVSTDVFRATNVSAGASKITIAHANSQNTTNRLSKAYGADARIHKLSSYDYYIRENPAGEPALYIRENGAVSELVEGTEDLQILYGEDTTDDKSADQYVDADAVAVSDWNNISGVRATFGLRSLTNNVSTSNQTYSYDGANITNRRLRQNMTSTISLRNRTP